MTDRIERFVEIFDLPPAMVPYLEYVVTEREIDLVLVLDKSKMTQAEVAEAMGMDPAEADEFLTSAFHRTVIEREIGDDGVARYAAADFYERLDPMAMYEQWGDVPAEARDAVLDWQLDEFINRHQEGIDQIRENPDALARVPNRDVLLLDEALEMVDAATDFVIIPCDCKTLVMACDYPTEVCVRLDEGARRTLEHGHGRQVTKEEMKQIVVGAHRAGLMQTGWREWRSMGRVFGFCNCCDCCCYPIRAGEKLGMHQVWPRAHHIADRDMDKCEHCGVCARRCHFDAFYRDGTKVMVDGKPRKTIAFNPDLCIGCGLCVTTCPDEAITMRPLTRDEDRAIEDRQLDVNDDDFIESTLIHH